MRILLAVLLASLSAAAEEKRFGDAGVFVPSGSIGYFETGSSPTKTFSVDQDHVTTISVAPALDLFVVQNLSLGLAVEYAHSWYGVPDSGSTSLGLAPRVGYNARLGDLLSLYPQVQLAWSHTTFSQGGTDSSASWKTVGVSIPLLVHPVRHFFIGMGPEVILDVAADGDDPRIAVKHTFLSLHTVIGGWF